MQSLSTWLGIISIVVSIIVLFTGLLVFVRGSYSKALIAALRADIGDYRLREEQHDRQFQDLNAKIAGLVEKIDYLTTENNMLRDMVTQRAAVETLTVALDVHHEESMQAWGDIKDAIERGQRDA